MGREQAQAKAGAPLRRKMWWLIAGRFVLAVALFALSFMFGGGGAGGASLDSLQSTLTVGLAVLLLSAFSAAMLRFSRVPL